MSLKVDSSTTPKGLDNVGATCYMNAVLQCFYHVKPLSAELINYNFPQNMGFQIPMTFAYLDVVRQLSDNKGSSAKPIAFKNAINVNPLFTGIQANDSKDLILYFLERIDQELTFINYITQNKLIYNTMRLNNAFYGNPELQSIFNVFVTNHKSIFSDLFYGFMSQTITCTKCKKKLTNYQIFNFIIFPIENVYNSKSNRNKISKEKEKDNYISKSISPYNMRPAGKPSMTSNSVYGNFYGEQQNNDYRKKINQSYGYSSNNNNFGGKNSVTLIDCFDNEIDDINFQGDNQIYCNNCRKLLDASGKNKIFSTPHVLILILNRGKANKFECDVEFEEELDIKKYVESEKCPTKFKLIGVISHFGESSMSGHFIADCLHFNNKWYCFNDGIVTGPSYNYAKRGTPYILFYENIAHF